LLLLLSGLTAYRLLGKLRKLSSETSFLKSRLQPDSFFGASGGQRIDTHQAAASATGGTSSMSYSLSQLDAIGDVDPVAEADVYLAYGRDLQAEEILKEAMRSNPDRLAIRTKLLEVYAKRRDTKAFELLATQLHAMTQGTGEDWARAQSMGQEIDPENPLYLPGGSPSMVDDAGEAIEVLNAATVPHAATPTPETFKPAADATLDAGVDLSLDLDLGAPSPTSAPAFRPDLEFSADDLKFDATASAKGQPFDEPAAGPATKPGGLDSLDFDLGDLGAAPAPAAASAAATPGDEFGEFTLPASAPPEEIDSNDPLQRKLELAEEFRQIGDIEGARDLLEEVVAKAEGALKSKAQGMLSNLI
ncbi:MAG: FimV/HubP family polar landmark protein, partial [Rubrivivax sp.]